jgi:hypothetical protein
MVELETINLLVQIVGVSAAAIATVVGVRSYMISNKRAEEAKKKEQETKDRELETRQAQLFMQIYGAYSSKEIQEAYGELMIWEWKDLDDFTSKYYHRKSLDVMNKWTAFVNGLGILVYEELIDVKLVYNLVWVELLNFYIRFELILKEIWERRKEPDEGKFVWYLIEECMRIYEERHGRKYISPSGPIALTHTEKPRTSDSNLQ